LSGIGQGSGKANSKWRMLLLPGAVASKRKKG